MGKPYETLKCLRDRIEETRSELSAIYEKNPSKTPFNSEAIRLSQLLDKLLVQYSKASIEVKEEY